MNKQKQENRWLENFAEHIIVILSLILGGICVGLTLCPLLSKSRDGKLANLAHLPEYILIPGACFALFIAAYCLRQLTKGNYELGRKHGLREAYEPEPEPEPS